MISFIVPIYNKGPYLERCLASLEQQSIQDIQILCVDNNSTDNSRSIMEAHAAADARIVVLEEREPGVSAARNCGLAHAAGDYVGFIDADDHIESDFAEVAERLAQESGFDVLMYEYDSTFEDDGTCVYWRQRTMPEPAMDTADLGPDLFLYSSPAVATKVFSKALIEEHGLRFDTRYAQGEDLLFSRSALLVARRVAQYQEKPMYHVSAGVAGSATENRKERGESLQVFDVLANLVDFAQTRALDPQNARKAVMRQALSEVRYAADIARTPEQFQAVYEHFCADWKEQLRGLDADLRQPYEKTYEIFVETEGAFEALFAMSRDRYESWLGLRKSYDLWRGRAKAAKAENAELKNKYKRVRSKYKKLAESAQAADGAAAGSGVAADGGVAAGGGTAASDGSAAGAGSAAGGSKDGGSSSGGLFRRLIGR